MNKRTVERILAELDMNKTDAAEALGMGRATFYRNYFYKPPNRLMQLALLGLLYQKRWGNLLDHNDKDSEEVIRGQKR